MSIRDFIRHHYRHFNAATVIDAIDGYEAHLTDGGRMMVTLAGAMSTAELGLSLAEMIRQDKVHAITCTGANLEEDVFNLVAHDHYERIPNWRNLTLEQEKDLEGRGMNRVTDTCIPEERAFRAIERQMVELWNAAAAMGERFFPHEYFYQLLLSGEIKSRFQIDPKDSWLLAAAEKDLPVFVPGWEDSTMGNVFVANVIRGDVPNIGLVRGGLEYMHALADWYVRTTLGRPIVDLQAGHGDGKRTGTHGRAIAADEAETTVGFFQIGGGIAGDFPICVVPMIHQDLELPCPYWAYFCQISDSTTSYGSYSGAVPAEKISWGKLDLTTPMYVIESDATIVAPLMFGALLGW
ncbi:MAG: deoxyhypusine synthase family protein [Gemmatimonadota bacterium]|nr:deoxyhypusine synthase family protein [Gemmatimonadota bacterium]MDH3428138.1 deoxyhypusine synthase family protein [Gemmatimonadota bacterium]